MKRLARLEIGILFGAAALTAAGLWSLTRPSVATPLTERAAALASGHRVEIGSARVSYGGGMALHIRDIDIEDRLNVEELDLRPNLLGFLPGIAFLKEASASRGAILIAQQGNSKTDDYERYVDQIALSDIGVTITREAATSRFRIVEAAGSLRGGELSFDALAGDGKVWFRGDGDLSDFDTIAGAVTVEGPNLANVAEALGIAAPDVPPFRLNGRLAIEGERWDLTGISGEIGDSDIGGDLSVDFTGAEPMITADIASQRLDFDDLGVIIGLPSRNEDGQALNEAQEAANRDYATSGRFIPDARIDMTRLATVDAEIAYSAETVVDAPLGLSRLDLDMLLKDSLLTIRAAEARLAEGTMTLSGELDARQAPARTRLEASFSEIHLENIVPNEMARGMLTGRADLALAGNDFRSAFAGADGTISFWGERAQIAAVPIEAAGLDLGELLLVMGGDENGEPVYVDASCIVARLEVEDGIGRTRPFVADTDDSTIVADGTVGFGQETLDLDVASDAKDTSWGRLLGGISVGGHWRDPAVNLSAEPTALQAIFAGLLGSIAAPLASLAFIETGDGEDAPCDRLLAQARSVAADEGPNSG